MPQIITTVLTNNIPGPVQSPYPSPDGTGSLDAKQGWFGTPPAVQQGPVTSVVTTAATSSSPFGFSSSQANAIVTGLNSVVTALRNYGLLST